LSKAILAEVDRIFQYLNDLALKFTTKIPVMKEILKFKIL